MARRPVHATKSPALSELETHMAPVRFGTQNRIIAMRSVCELFDWLVHVMNGDSLREPETHRQYAIFVIRAATVRCSRTPKGGVEGSLIIVPRHCAHESVWDFCNSQYGTSE